MKALFCKIKVL